MEVSGPTGRNAEPKAKSEMSANTESTDGTRDEAASVMPSAAEAHACHAQRDPRRPLDWRCQRARRLIARGLTPDAEWDDEATHEAFGLLTNSDNGPEHLREALKIYNDGTLSRWELEARVLANRNVDDTAQQLTIPVKVIAAYEQLFFNVLDRIDFPRYVMGIVIHKPAVFDASDVRSIWLYLGYVMGTEIFNDIVSDFYSRGHTDYTYAITTNLETELADEPFGRLLDRIVRLMCTPNSVAGFRYIAGLASVLGQLDETYQQHATEHADLADQIGDMLDDAFADLQTEVFEELQNKAG